MTTKSRVTSKSVAPTAASGPLGPEELRRMHAWWRACNYLAVGMIYLRDNPLLREPLSVEHVKHRLLGHWGASPALSFVWAHLNRVIKRDDLDVIFVAGPGHGAPGVLGARLPRRHLLRDLSRQERGRRGHAEVLQAVLLPRPHRQPRDAGDAGLDPRRRRARLQPVARLRRGARQSRPDRRLRGRRRRGRDRPARHRLALEQVHQPGRATARCCRSSTSTATRSPIRRSWRASATRSWRRCSSATATRRTSSRAPTRREMHQKMAATLDEAIAQIRAIQREARASGTRRAPALADDRAALAQGLDRTEGDQGPQGRGLVALAPGAVLRRARESRQPEAAARLAARATSRRSCSTPTAA